MICPSDEKGRLGAERDGPVDVSETPKSAARQPATTPTGVAKKETPARPAYRVR